MAEKRSSVLGIILEMFQQSIIIQSLITLIVIGVAAYMMMVGSLEAIPDQWWGLTTLVVGYWVGSKGNFQQSQVNRRMLRSMEKQTEMFAAMTATLKQPTPD